MKKNNIKGAFVYPKPNERSQVRTIAHGIKAMIPEAVLEAAKQMAKHIPTGSVLVPIPGAKGFSSSALLLANAIAQIKRVGIADVLESRPRVSQYAAKKFGGGLTAEQMQMKLKDGAKAPKNAVLIDNVAGTGETIRAARLALGSNVLAVVYAAEKTLFDKAHQKEIGRRGFDIG